MASAPSRPRSKSAPVAAKAAVKAPVKRARAAASAPVEDVGKLLTLYTDMVLIREFELQVIELFRSGDLPGFLHVAIGQEAVAVGVSAGLEDGDFIGSTHRAHGHILARGTDPMRMMAELMGRKIGFCQGKGGSMHVADMSRWVVGANGVVGAGAPMMTGVALAQQQRKTGKVAVAFYGDGASSEGNVYEAMNLAQLWRLPAIFVIEDNGYAESTPKAQHSPITDMADRGVAVGMKTITVDGNDVLAVRDAAVEARAHAVSGKGPVYLVCNTQRLEGHYVGDAEVYRPKG